MICRRLRAPGLLISLLLALSTWLLPAGAHAIGPGSKVRVVRIRYPGGNWNPRPEATRVLAQEVAFRTSIETDPEPMARTLDDPELFEDPILLLGGDQAFDPLPENDVARLRHLIEAGGMLIIDNNGESERAYRAFEDSARRLMRRLFPGSKVGAVSSEHVIFRSFFRLDYPSGRNVRKGYVEGITLGRRVAVVYLPNDLGGALERDHFGGWVYDLVPGGGRQREMAIRLGVNLVMHALCLHYKDDQVHLRHLLKSRSWRIKPPENP